MTTIKDVSRLANVSISTVSRVINKSANVNPEKAQAVRDAMKQLNFMPNSFAQALVNKRSNCIGVLVGDLCGGPFFAQMMRGIESVILPENKYVMVMSGNHDHDREKNSIEALMLRRCDALIIHSKALSDDELVEFAQSGIPMVFANREVASLEHHSVWVDISAGMAEAVRYLIKQGHRKIAYICSDDASFADEQDRLNGYKKALEEAGIPFDANLVSGAFPDENGGYKAIESLMMRDAGFTAYVAYNDAMAVGALSALADNNINVPGQVSAIGYDDNPITNYIKPRLTTVRYPIEEVGKKAAALALSLLEQDDDDDEDEEEDDDIQTPRKKRQGIKLMPELIEKASVAAVEVKTDKKSVKKAK